MEPEERKRRYTEAVETFRFLGFSLLVLAEILLVGILFEAHSERFKDHYTSSQVNFCIFLFIGIGVLLIKCGVIPIMLSISMWFLYLLFWLLVIGAVGWLIWSFFGAIASMSTTTLFLLLIIWHLSARQKKE